MARLPISTVSVRLPARRSWSRSRRLLASSTAHAMSPAPTPPSQASCGTMPACTNVVPTVATSPKNTKTNTSPRPAVAVGALAAGVEPGRRRCRRHRPAASTTAASARRRRGRRARPTAKNTSATVSTVRGFALRDAGEARRADAVIVGAADAVAVVVGVVDADLQGERHDEAAERDHPVQRRVDDECGPGADHDRRDRQRERAQPRGADPVAERRRLDAPRITGDARLLRVAPGRVLLLRGLLSGAGCHEQ